MGVTQYGRLQQCINPHNVATDFYIQLTHTQLLDLPGIIEGAKDGKGRGRQVIAVARTCGLIFIVLDVLKPLEHKRLLEHELEGFGIRLNKRPPNIGFKRKDKGGINLTAAVRRGRGKEGGREEGMEGGGREGWREEGGREGSRECSKRVMAVESCCSLPGSPEFA